MAKNEEFKQISSRRYADIIRELGHLRALGAEIVQRSSRLEEDLAALQGKAPRKAKPDIVQAAIDKRNRRIYK